jgi:hypothetical protein
MNSEVVGSVGIGGFVVTADLVPFLVVVPVVNRMVGFGSPFPLNINA